MGRVHYNEEKIIAKLTKAQILIERWRRDYNEIRPHSSLGGYKPPAPLAVLPSYEKDKVLNEVQ